MAIPLALDFAHRASHLAYLHTARLHHFSSVLVILPLEGDNGKQRHQRERRHVFEQELVGWCLCFREHRTLWVPGSELEPLNDPARGRDREQRRAYRRHGGRLCGVNRGRHGGARLVEVGARLRCSPSSFLSMRNELK